MAIVIIYFLLLEASIPECPVQYSSLAFAINLRYNLFYNAGNLYIPAFCLVVVRQGFSYLPMYMDGSGICWTMYPLSSRQIIWIHTISIRRTVYDFSYGFHCYSGLFEVPTLGNR